MRGTTGSEVFLEVTGSYAYKGAAAEMVLAGRRVIVEMTHRCVGACLENPAARVMQPDDGFMGGVAFCANSAEAVTAAVAGYEIPAEPKPRG